MASTTMGSRRRPAPIAWIAGGLVLVVVSVALAVGPQVVRWAAMSGVVQDVSERIEAVPGVIDVTTELDQRIQSNRQIRRDLIAGRDRPDGSVAAEVVVSGTADAAALARIHEEVRAALADERLDEHEVSITIRQHTTGLHVLDGWTPQLDARTFTTEQLDAVAAFALSLPDDAWLDLEPASYEQGWLGQVGPDEIGGLLGLEEWLGGGTTVRVPVETASGVELLATADRLAAEATTALGGTIAIELRTPDDMVVRTATSPTAFPESVADLGALLATLPDPDTVHVDLVSTLAWPLGDEYVEQGVPTVELLLDLGADACATGVDLESLLTDVEELYDARGVDHDVSVLCAS